MEQHLTLSRQAIKAMYETNQLAKRSFETYFAFPNGICLPRQISRYIEDQRTVIESEGMKNVFRELRLDSEPVDGLGLGLLINTDGVFRALEKVTMVVGLILKGDNYYAIVEPNKKLETYYESMEGFENLIRKLESGNFEIHIAKLFRNIDEHPSSRFIYRYIHEFNSESDYDGVFNPIEIPKYTSSLSKEEVVSVYDKDIIHAKDNGLIVILLKPFLQGISKASNVDYTFIRHDDVNKSFAAYFSLSKIKGIQAHHKFEAIDLIND